MGVTSVQILPSHSQVSASKAVLLHPPKRARVLRLLIEEVRYDGQVGELEIVFRDIGIKALSREITGRRSA